MLRDLFRIPSRKLRHRCQLSLLTFNLRDSFQANTGRTCVPRVPSCIKCCYSLMFAQGLAPSPVYGSKTTYNIIELARFSFAIWAMSKLNGIHLLIPDPINFFNHRVSVHHPISAQRPLGSISAPGIFTESRIGKQRILISCATCLATSRHVAARSAAIRSSKLALTPVPSG